MKRKLKRLTRRMVQLPSPLLDTEMLMCFPWPTWNLLKKETIVRTWVATNPNQSESWQADKCITFDWKLKLESCFKCAGDIIPIVQWFLIWTVCRKEMVAQQREYKKKKALKKAQRMKELEQEREEQKVKWQQFNNRAYSKNKKGQVHIKLFSSFPFYTFHFHLAPFLSSSHPRNHKYTNENRLLTFYFPYTHYTQLQYYP